MNWEEIGRKLPLICCISVEDFDEKSKLNLLRCGLQFDFNIVLLAKEEDKEKCISHLMDNDLQNFGIFAVKDSGVSLQDISYSLVLQKFRNCHCLFVNHETTVGENIRWKVFDRISKMSSPYDTLYLSESCDILQKDPKMILRWACQ